jgi:hypothetical protein
MTPNNDRDRWSSPSALEPKLSWSGILRVALTQLGGKASIRAIHLKLERELFPRTQFSTQTKQKLREALTKDPAVQQVSRMVWRLRESSTTKPGAKPS